MITIEFVLSGKFKDSTKINRKIAQLLYQALKITTPVKTGKLRRGWDIKTYSRNGFILTNDVEYGKWVDGGNTRGLLPRLFTYRAINMIKNKANNLLPQDIDTLYRNYVIYN